MGFILSFLHYICENDWAELVYTLHYYLRLFKMTYLRVNSFKFNYYDGKDVFKDKLTTVVGYSGHP